MEYIDCKNEPEVLDDTKWDATVGTNVDRCGGLPLALGIAGGTVANYSRG